MTRLTVSTDEYCQKEGHRDFGEAKGSWFRDHEANILSPWQK